MYCPCSRKVVCTFSIGVPALAEKTYSLGSYSTIPDIPDKAMKSPPCDIVKAGLVLPPTARTCEDSHTAIATSSEESGRIVIREKLAQPFPEDAIHRETERELRRLETFYQD